MVKNIGYKGKQTFSNACSATVRVRASHAISQTWISPLIEGRPQEQMLQGIVRFK